jgi:hypothetical protein
MCGQYFPVPNYGAKPIVVTKLSEEDEKMALDKEKLKLLHGQGKSDKEIADVLNAKTGTVWAARKALGLKANYTLSRTPQRSIDRPIKTNKLSPDKLKKTVMPSEKDFISDSFFYDPKNRIDNADKIVIGAIDMRLKYHKNMIDKLTQVKQILLA